MTSVGRPLGLPLPTGGHPSWPAPIRASVTLGQRFATDRSVTFRRGVCASADERGW